MSKLREHLNYVKQPNSKSKVYKDESVYDYDTPESPDGLFVCLKTFYGVSRNFLDLHHLKTGNHVYLHIQRTKTEHSLEENTEERPSKRSRANRAKFDYDEQLKVVLYPDFESYDLFDPDLPEVIQESVVRVISAKSAEEEFSGYQCKSVQRPVTRFADLQQLDNGVKVPPKGRVCSKCDKRDNLWMNLTDGTIGCGRRYYDGSGGNHHAVEYYEQTNYPLVVKLGTIKSRGAEVFSYPEDQMVDDPKLSEHLAHFGIQIASVEQQTKTFNEWATALEAGGNLKPLYGPGYVGMQNLGNSCYLNSVMQVLFSTPEFKQTYYPPYAPERDIYIYASAPDPTQDFDFQMAKLAYGLHSDCYSFEQSGEQKGIRATSFKQLVGKNHPEFATQNQQDAEEFFRHLMDLIEKSHKQKFKVLPNLSDLFKFKIEDRTRCLASGKVHYTHRTEYVLSLPIALDKASNLAEVQAYLRRKANAEAYGRTPPKLVRPRVRLLDCLKLFESEGIIDDFRSPETNTKTQAKRQYRLETYPDYLVVHMQKYDLDDNWSPKKIECSLDAPDELDLAFLRGRGPQPGESLMADSIQPPEICFDERLVDQLLEMGFKLDACKRALLRTKTEDVNVALDWLNGHLDDADFNAPIEHDLKKLSHKRWKSIVCEGPVKKITEMGIPRSHAIRGLDEHEELDLAINWILENTEKLEKVEEESSMDDDEEFRDGREKYRLVAFISHMGESTQWGHYVCHIVKDGRWVLHNDSQVVESERPPIDLAYMYLYKRVD